MENKIPLLSEVNPDLLDDGKYYAVYFSKLHKDSDSKGWFNGKQLKEFIKLSDETNERLQRVLLWGK